MKPTPLYEFYRHLHARGLTVALLAEFIGRDRVTVTRVLNGARRRGPVWAKLVPHLTPAEIALLDVAHSSTWNTNKIMARPSWSAMAPRLNHA